MTDSFEATRFYGVFEDNQQLILIGTSTPSDIGRCAVYSEKQHAETFAAKFTANTGKKSVVRAIYIGIPDQQPPEHIAIN